MRRRSGEWTALALAAMLLSACTEITTNDIMGTVDASWRFTGEDTLQYDAAAELEGLWIGGWESEEDMVSFVEHVGVGSLKVWVPTWKDGILDFGGTVAVVSDLNGDGFLNINPMLEGGRDSARYWPFRYILGADKLRLHFLKEDFIISAHEAEMISAIDTIESDRIEIDAKQLATLLVEFEWEPWVVDEVMIWRRIGDLPE